MKLKRSLAVVFSIVAVLLFSVLALCINGSSQEKTAKEEIKKVTKDLGWAEPELIVGQPRLQKVNGFYYLYAEMKHLKTSEVTESNVLIKQVNDACMKLFGRIPFGTYVEMYINLPQEAGEYMYDCQKGYAIPDNITPVDGVKIRYVEPALCASILVWGTEISKSYGPLMDFVNGNGLKCAEEGWREWWLHYEGDNSKNNITLVQHVLKEE
jgi:hypothetical protein